MILTKKNIISLHNNNWSVFAMQTECPLEGRNWCFKCYLDEFQT